MPINNIPSNKSHTVESKVDAPDDKGTSAGSFDGRTLTNVSTTSPKISKLMEKVKQVEGRLAAHKSIYERTILESAPVREKMTEFDKRLERITSELNEDSERELELIIQDVKEYDLGFATDTISLLHGLIEDKSKKQTSQEKSKLLAYEKELKQMEQQLKEIQVNKKDSSNDALQELITKLNVLKLSVSDNKVVEENNQSEQTFLNNLSQWESQGNADEDRATAVAKIKKAYTEKATSLSIGHLKLSDIPEAIFEIPSLEELNISHNNIGYIPDKFDKLPKLKEFSCFYINQDTQIPETLLKHPYEWICCWGFADNLQWFGNRQNYLNRDSVIVQSHRKRHKNEDGTVNFEQGPMNLSPKALQERKYWVYNKEPLTVYRGAQKLPREILAEGGIHTKSLSTEGLVFHVNIDTYTGSNLTGGVVSTSQSLEVAKGFARKKRGYVYKIELEPKQGLDINKTCKAIIKADVVTDETELSLLQKAHYLSGVVESEIAVISSISPNQITVLNEKANSFIPISEWVE